MKTMIKSFAFLAAILVMVSAFSPKATSTYKVDAGKSTITWVGKKVTGEHTGKVKVKSGDLKFDGNTLKSGSFVVDMNSITCTDLEDKEYNGKLVGHLKSDDFFGVEKNPEAKLVITSATSKGKNTYEVKGNLTIKGQTHPVTFPATATAKGNVVTASAKIEVDRTKYDIKYGSSSFFDSLGDKAIDNIFTLQVDLVATK